MLSLGVHKLLSQTELRVLILLLLVLEAEFRFLFLQISDQIRGSRVSDTDRARSMEYSLLMTTFISVLGGLCFIICSWYLVKDRDAAEEYTRANEDDSSLLGSITADTYLANGDENQVLRNDEDFHDERDALIVPVDVHGALPAHEKQNSHPVI